MATVRVRGRDRIVEWEVELFTGRITDVVFIDDLPEWKLTKHEFEDICDQLAESDWEQRQERAYG